MEERDDMTRHVSADEGEELSDVRQTDGLASAQEALQDALLEEYSYPSLFGEAEVFTVETDEGEALRVLYVGGGFQSATYLGECRFEAPFAYCRAFDVLFERQPQAKDILLLGGGAYSYPKHVLTNRSDVRMDVVEIDPVIIDIARRHFFVDELAARCETRLRSFAQDGLAFLRQAQPGSYDALINDSFAGTLLDAPLLSPEGLRLAKRALRETGSYLVNVALDEGDEVGSQARGQEELASITATLATVFAEVQVLSVQDEDFAGCVNHIFVCSSVPMHPSL